MTNIYGFQKTYDRALKLLNESEIIKHNKEAIINFDVKYSKLHGIGLGRRYKYLTDLTRIAKIINPVEFEKMSKDDYFDLKTALTEKPLCNASRNAEKPKTILNNSTINTSLKIFKTFMRWLLDLGKTDTISCMKGDEFLKCKEHVKAENILTEDEVKQLIEASNSIKYKAMISCLYYGGCRIAECLNLTVQSCRFEGDGNLLMSLTGKTGTRNVPMIRAGIPYLKAYIQSLNKTEGFLFVNDKKQVFQFKAYFKQLRILGKKLGINKPTNPHNFRHSVATMLSCKFTEPYMRRFFGWTRKSSMPSVYVHLLDKDLTNEMNKIHGIRDSRDEDVKEQLVKCTNPDIKKPCHALNTKDSLFCVSCGYCINDSLRQSKETSDLRKLILECIKSELK